MGLSKYERQREANIAKNKELLVELGLDVASLAVSAPPKIKPVTKKRKAVEVVSNSEANGDLMQTKKTRLSPTSDNTDASGLRRSSRSRTTPVDYNSSNFENHRAIKSVSTNVRGSNHVDRQAASENSGNCLGKRIHDPKTFGHIPGVEVGTWWETRAHCSTDAVHAPFVAGISADSQKGAYSVALSGGYADDVDLGYAFTFTGSGGRDLKGTAAKPKNLRTAPQSSDQSFENSFNKSLQVSAKTKKPVRVIRGYKLQSKYAPAEGYRYDGLYRVEKAWMEPGLNDEGFLVCKFAFKRLPGQPALIERDGETQAQEEEEEDGDDDEAETEE